ncbi:MAG: (d)CMP kinase [Proteobacteria bacterium]|nr:(d)CMP kinase [Pseudomonadota bacterium]
MLEVVTIDGPSGSGKSTVSKALAKRLNYSYLDTGAMYRAFALEVLTKGLENHKEKYINLLKDFYIEFSYNSEHTQRVICNGRDVTDHIRTPEVSMWASTISKEKEVREKMGYLQRKMGEKGKFVAEGRDMGTVVFKDAFVKFYLFASPEVRAMRRYKELLDKKIQVTYEEVLEDVKKRDEQDSNRELAPLKPAEDAILIDSSELTVDEVVDKMYSIVMEKKRLWKYI